MFRAWNLTIWQYLIFLGHPKSKRMKNVAFRNLKFVVANRWMLPSKGMVCYQRSYPASPIQDTGIVPEWATSAVLSDFPRPNTTVSAAISSDSLCFMQGLTIVPIHFVQIWYRHSTLSLFWLCLIYTWRRKGVMTSTFTDLLWPLHGPLGHGHRRKTDATSLNQF